VVLFLTSLLPKDEPLKKRLFTPGPTPVPESVMLRMAAPIIHHRHREFTEILAKVHANLKYLFQTSGDVLSLTSSGTGAMEAAVANIHSPGDSAVFVNGGKFGERWGELLRIYGVNAQEINVPWGDSISAEAMEKALKALPQAGAVYLTQSETSTGAATDIKEIASVIRKHSKALVVVDGITAVGAMELRMDAWSLDVVVTGSQKGLMIPPGLAFIGISSRAWEMIGSSRCPRYYFDLSRARKAASSSDTPWTPAITLMIGVEAALEMIRQEGLEQVWARHTRLSSALRAALEGLGLDILAKKPSSALTAFRIPEGVDGKKLNAVLKDSLGITIAGGQGHLTGKILRISHLGYYDELDMISVISALELALAQCGHAFETGAGLRAAQSVFQGRHV
jgi:aspartate aminotransferase-like enzyme